MKGCLGSGLDCYDNQNQILAKLPIGPLQCIESHLLPGDVVSSLCAREDEAVMTILALALRLLTFIWYQIVVVVPMPREVDVGTGRKQTTLAQVLLTNPYITITLWHKD